MVISVVISTKARLLDRLISLAKFFLFLKVYFEAFPFWECCGSGCEPRQGVGKESLLEDRVQFGNALVEKFCVA
jgi:hypothetical protein